MKKYLSTVFILSATFLLAGCGKESDPNEYTMTQQDAYTLSDGTTVSRWEPNPDSLSHSYRLEDGEELLNVELPTTIDKSQTQGLNGYKNMEPDALQAALDYYAKQELSFDVAILLENACKDYNACKEENTLFHTHLASESIDPCVETERFTGFLTTSEVPGSLQYDVYEEFHQVVLFDNQTGDVIPSSDLFSISQEEALSVLTAYCAQDTGIDVLTLQPLIYLDRIEWMQDGIWLTLTQEELPDAESDYHIQITYDKMADYLNSWAIPKSDD